MILLPIGDENPTQRFPFVNWTLIALNIAVFVYMLTGVPDANAFVLRWGLDPAHAVTPQALTCAFLHAGWGHLLNNMLMLWIVGDNVEDKLGHVAYLAFYLVGAVMASWAFAGVGMLTADVDPDSVFGVDRPPLVGASGAVFAVAGVYLVFFPKARIRLVYWFFFIIGVLRISALWLLGIYMLIDAVQTIAAAGPATPEHVATAAHVGGGLFGIAIGVLTKSRVGGGRIDGDAWDAHTGFAERSRDSQDRWSQPGEGAWLAPPLPSETGMMNVEERLVDLVHDGRTAEAVELYPRYERHAREKPLPGDVQIDIAHEYFRQGLGAEALAAYERYLDTEPRGPFQFEARFRMGVLLGRVFHRPEEAAHELRLAARKHPDPEIRKFAHAEIERLYGMG